MRVTIAIPHFRSEESLGFLLQSLCEQKTRLDKKDIEVIVVNDEPRNISVADRFTKQLNVKILNQEHQGPAVARNTALKEANGELIFYLDSDSIPYVDWLETLFSSFINNPAIDSIGGRVVPLKQKGFVNDYFNLVNDLEKPQINKITGEIMTVITANCGFKTNALRTVGGFNENAFRFIPPGGEDMDVSYRLRNKNYHFAYEPKAIVRHIYPQGISSLIKKYRNYGVGLRRYIEFNNINPEDINQASLNPIFYVPYLFKIPLKLQLFIKNLRSCKSFWRILIYLFFFVLKYIAFGYGYFIKGKYNPKFNYETEN